MCSGKSKACLPHAVTTLASQYDKKFGREFSVKAHKHTDISNQKKNPTGISFPSSPHQQPHKQQPNRMSKKKGMSMEEKILKVEEYFHEHPVPFTLKELMVNIPKAKGVIFQSIEECIEVLVSEGRVCQEKIGISVFYWWFPVDATAKAEADVTSKKMKLANLEAELAATEARYAEIIRTQFNGDESLIAAAVEQQRQNTEKEQYLRQLNAEMKACADRDPVVIQQLLETRKIAIDGVNRWTDNLFLIEDYVTKKMQITRKEFRREAGLPPQLDFIDDNDEDVAK